MSETNPFDNVVESKATEPPKEETQLLEKDVTLDEVLADIESLRAKCRSLGAKTLLSQASEECQVLVNKVGKEEAKKILQTAAASVIEQKLNALRHSEKNVK